MPTVGYGATNTAHIGQYWTNGTASTLTAQYAWQAWTQTASTTNMVDVWPYWTAQTQYAPAYQQQAPIVQTPPSAAEVEWRRVEREARERIIAEAKAKAEVLLRESLDAAQITMLERSDYFEVVAPETLRRYRIARGWVGNVKEIDEAGHAVASLCVHPAIDVPHADNMLAQKLFIETSEAEFRRTANISPLVGARR